MKLIFHIVRKDAARVRWLWLAWLGVLAAKLGLALLIALGDTSRFSAIPPEPSLLILNALDAVLVYLLAAWMMLEDAPMNNRHFGRTRPISRGTLLAAKITGALTLFWLPAVMVWLPWWIYCGFTASDICAEAGVVLAGKALTVLPAFLVASLVDSFRRLLLWTPVWLGALMIALPVPFMWMLNRSVGAEGAGDDLEMLGLWQSRFLLAGAVLVGGAASLLVWQFFRRRPRETVVALAAGFAMVWVIVLRAPWNFWPDGGDWAETHPERARGVQPELVSTRLRGDRRLEFRWRAETSPDVVLWPMRSVIAFREKIDLTHGNDDSQWHDPRRDDSSLIWERLDFDTIPARAPESNDASEPEKLYLYGERFPYWSEQCFFLYSWSVSGEHRAELPQRLISRMLLAQVEYQVPRPQPVATGVLTSGKGRKVRVIETAQNEHGVWLSGLDTRREKLSARRWAEFFAPLAYIRAQETLSADGLALIDGWNRERSPQINLRWSTYSWMNSLFGAGSIRTVPMIGGVAMRRFNFSAFPPFDPSEGRSREPITHEWLAGLRLVAVERRETARILREVTVDPLTITEAKDGEQN